jgi:hypothetical protein
MRAYGVGVFADRLLAGRLVDAERLDLAVVVEDDVAVLPGDVREALGQKLVRADRGGEHVLVGDLVKEALDDETWHDRNLLGERGAVYDYHVPRYLIIRRFSITEGEMPAVGRRSRELVDEDFPEVTWEHSHVVVDGEGTVRTYCVYGAPDEDVVMEHSKRLGAHHIEGLHEIAGDVSPADFPPE